VSEVVAPVSGEVVEVNTKVVEEPETINDDPYGEGWLVRVRLADPTELDSLLDPDSYRKLTAEQ
jgi:glycine cleavage system H protein